MEEVSFTLNGKPVTVTTDADRMLLWVLRTDLGLTGTKFGCGQGYCGACIVIVGDSAVRSCHFPLRRAQGQQVLTIEGLERDGRLHPLQEAFVEHDALQCGFCTPGMIMNAYSLLRKNSRLSREDILEGMENNLCRCGAHARMVTAIEAAGEKMRGAGR